MKNNINKILVKGRLAMILLILFTVSCSKEFLELQPLQSVSTEQALSNINDFSAAITGAYDGLSSSNYYGRYFVLVSDIMSDDVKQNASANRAADWAAYAGSPSDNNGLADNIWEQGYRVINRCNRIILTEIEVPATAQDLYDDIKGQAYAIRALVHFDMCKTYAQHYTFTADASHLGVPIVTTLDPFLKPARNTVKEVYDQVINDFNTALTLIGNSNNSFFLTQDAVNALLSRVYLYKEDWANAVAAANAVSSSYELVPNANYADIFTDDHSSETLFEIDMNSTDNRGSDALCRMYLEGGYGDYLPSQDLINLIHVDDIRATLFLPDPNLNGIYASLRVNKYSDINSTDNTPVIRLSEVILNRAEANYHLNNISEAQADLELIRKRGLPTAPDVTETGVALLDEILRERRIELSFEGHRLFDLTRNKKGVFRNDCTSSVCSVPYPNDRFVLAIGEFEMEVNENMVQNPGY